MKQLRQELISKTEFRGEVHTVLFNTNLDTSNVFSPYQKSVVYSYIQCHIKMFSTSSLLFVCFKVQAVSPAVLMECLNHY